MPQPRSQIRVKKPAPYRTHISATDEDEDVDVEGLGGVDYAT